MTKRREREAPVRLTHISLTHFMALAEHYAEIGKNSDVPDSELPIKPEQVLGGPVDEQFAKDFNNSFRGYLEHVASYIGLSPYELAAIARANLNPPKNEKN